MIAIDYTGKRFGLLVVLNEFAVQKKISYFVCKCNCGTVKVINKYSVLNGVTATCGCIKPGTKKQYKDLCVIKKTRFENGVKYFNCLCSCWKIVEVSFNDLENGQITNCGSCDFSIKRKVLNGDYKKSEHGVYVYFSNSAKKFFVELRVNGMKIRRLFNTREEAVEKQKELEEIYLKIRRDICAAIDCDNKLNDKISAAKYCSDRCRWREHKRMLYQRRKEHGLCPQCGGEMDMPENDISYCKTCKLYFKERYYAQK